MLRYKELLETDVLTGLKSRYAYTEDLKRLDEADSLPEDLAVFSIDINELKVTNDHYGHLAGDELIQGAASCIRQVLGEHGTCYRTGGDEFIALLHVDSNLVYKLKVRLLEVVDQWHGEKIRHLSLSVGYAIAKEYPEITISEALIHAADEKMYEAKAQFYMQSPKSRSVKEIKRREMIEQLQREYMDIISVFASDLTGLYVIDRRKHEVTAYRISATDHQIRSGVPLKLGFEAAMDVFIDKRVHPDDKETMRQCIRQEFIERELVGKKSFVVHFRTLSHGEISYNYMKCIRNKDDESYDKLIISFCPEDAVSNRRRIQESLRLGTAMSKKILVVMEKEGDLMEVKELLEDQYDCITARDGKTAMELLEKNYAEISLVFYERALSGLPASSFLRWMKEDMFASAIPVIVVNNRSEIDELEITQCIEAGAMDFIRKPYHKKVVRSRVANIIKGSNLFTSLDEIEIDDLTGLYTKQAFLYHAGTLIKESPKEDFSIIIADILNFKLYNRAYGINEGDNLLRAFAKAAQGSVINGICARYGADQIITIVKTMDTDIDVYLKHLQENLNRHGQGNVVLKFGIYAHIDHNLEVASICDRALQALQSIKKNYDLMSAYFDGPVSQQQIRAQLFEARFSKAIKEQEFVVWYQPKYDPYAEKIIGAEALVRWQMEDGKLIFPGEFLPIFENDGLISRLDEYVFRCVCRQQKKWKDMGWNLFPVSVNLSRNSMHRTDVIKRYKAILDEYGIAPNLVPIEITESAATGNMEIKPLADAFYEAGFSLHMDDFGSENSSIVGLNLLHFDTVKLDRSLVQFIGTEEGNLVLMYTVSLGKELGYHIVAEGAETKEQIEYLRDIGCEGIQGYYYSKAIPVAEFEEKVLQNSQPETDTRKYDYRFKLTMADSIVKRAMNRMIQRMPGGFFTYRRDNGQILASNSYLWGLFGCSSEIEFMAYVGGTFQGMVYEEDLRMVEDYIKEQIRDNEKEMDYVEYRICPKDGELISVVDYGHLDHQPDGDIFYVFINKK